MSTGAGDDAMEAETEGDTADRRGDGADHDKQVTVTMTGAGADDTAVEVVGITAAAPWVAGASRLAPDYQCRILRPATRTRTWRH